MPQAKPTLRRPKAANDDTPVKLEPDTSAAFDYMRRLDQNGLHMLLAFDDSGPVTTIEGTLAKDSERFEAFIRRHNGRHGRSIYVTMNEPVAGLDKKPSDQEIARIRAVAIDIDFKADPAVDEIDRGNRIDDLLDDESREDASLAVRTGDTGGVQIYYLLETPIACDEKTREMAREISRTAAVKFGGDKTFDPSRIMRLPGTVNYPTAAKRKAGRVPFIAKIVRKSKVRFTLPELQEHFPVDPNAVGKARARGKLRKEDQQSLQELEYADEATDGNELALARELIAEKVEDDAVFAALWRNAKGNASETMLGGLGQALGRLLAGEIPDRVASTVVAEWLAKHAKEQNQNDRFVAKAMTQYRKGASQASASEAFGVVDDSDDDAPKSKKTIKPFNLEYEHEAAKLYTPEEYLIENVIPAKGVGILYGQSQTKKSFAAVDMGFHLTTGRNWFGLATKKTGAAMWVGEGDLRGRIKGWRKFHDHDGEAFATFADELNIFDDPPNELMKRFKQLCADYLAATGMPLGIVFIDTAIKASIGANELEARDVSKILRILEVIGQECKIVIALIAHAGKDFGRGIRGSSAWETNTDFIVAFYNDSFEVKKLKDGRIGTSFRILTKKVQIGRYKDGRPATTLVVLPGDRIDSRKAEREARLVGAQLEVFDAIQQITDETGEPATNEAARKMVNAARAARGNKPIPDETFRAAKHKLIKNGHLADFEGRSAVPNFTPAVTDPPNEDDDIV